MPSYAICSYCVHVCVDNTALSTPSWNMHTVNKYCGHGPLSLPNFVEFVSFHNFSFSIFPVRSLNMTFAFKVRYGTLPVL